jgi:hypothetical protein
MPDEAHFHTSGCVNRRNCRYWCHGKARVPSSFRHGEQCSAVWHLLPSENLFLREHEKQQSQEAPSVIDTRPTIYEHLKHTVYALRT